MRYVVWFSCGATSAVAAKLTLAKYDNWFVDVVYTDPGSEHPDSVRFLADCAKWFDHEIITLRSEKYRDTWQVWEERRWLNGPQGALCTVELKKKLRMAYERPGDIQVFGYDANEAVRADRFRKLNPEVDLRTPLIDHNNCIGCPKGGIGYWNKIRVDYPVVFERMARLERELDATCTREMVDGDTYDVEEDGETTTHVSRSSRAVFLDELDPDRGSYETEPKIECSLLCAMAEADLAEVTP